MDIETPKAFRDAVRNLGQDILEEIESLDHLARIVLIGVDLKDGTVIREFIDRVLAGGYDAETLKEFWLSTPSTIYFHNGDDVTAVLEAIRNRLNQPPYVEAASTG